MCTQLWTEFFIFRISIQIDCNRISEGLLYVVKLGVLLGLEPEIWADSNECHRK
jgi:hypothetical protein